MPCRVELFDGFFRPYRMCEFAFLQRGFYDKKNSFYGFHGLSDHLYVFEYSCWKLRVSRLFQRRK